MYFHLLRGSNDALIYASGLRSIRDLLSSQDEVSEASEIPTIGSGFSKRGCSQVDPSKFCIVACAPRFHMPNMLTRLFSEEQVAQVLETGSCPWSSPRGDLIVTRDDANVVLHQLDMRSVCHDIPPEVPILLLHGTDDELISVDDAMGYKEMRPSIDLTIIEGARHAFRGKKQNKILLSTISEWLSARCRDFFPDAE